MDRLVVSRMNVKTIWDLFAVQMNARKHLADNKIFYSVNELIFKRCPTGYYWHNTTFGCGKRSSNIFYFLWPNYAFSLLKVVQREYSSICDSTNDQCSTALGLACTNSFYSCDCPTELPAYRCDCGPTEYYKDSDGFQNRSSHGDGCSGTHTCMPNLNLICSDTFVCTCIENYYWTGSICSMFLIIYSVSNHTMTQQAI